MTQRLSLALAAGLALFIAVPASADPVVTPIAEVVESDDVGRADDQLYHRGSAYAFPNALGDMPARKLTVFGAGDVSVNYTVNGGAAGDSWIDLYVYPADGPIEQTDLDIASAITSTFKATPTQRPAGMAVAAGDAMSGWFAGQLGDRKFLTGYYVVQRGDWLIKARITMPAPPSQEILDRTARAVSAIDMGDLPGGW